MNWTGGHLKRHSKGNANRLLKSQKQYFAKARQRLQNGSAPAPPLIFSHFNGQLFADQPVDLNRNPPGPQRLLRSSKKVPRRNASRDGSDTPTGATSSRDNDSSARNLTTRHEHILPRAPKEPEKPKPLDHIKRRLLQNSDWTGLALARPVCIKFTPAEEMERIGRRRKVTKEERTRKNQPFGQQKVHHNLIRPFDDRHSQSTAPVPEGTDLSIRIGSNIHQTLTTQPSLLERPKSSSYHSTNGESMLLDRFEHYSGDTRQNGLEALFLGADAESMHASGRTNLVPLDAARDFKSFDEVLQRSSSIVRQMLPSSTPFGGGLPSQGTPVRASPRWTSPVSLYGSSLPPEDGFPTLDKTKHISLAARNSRNGAEEQARLGSIQRSEPGPPISGAGLSKFQRPTTTSNYGDQPSTSIAQAQARNFTLDHQFASERKSSGQGCSYLQEEGPVANTIENHQITHHSLNSASQIVTNGTPLPTTLSLAYTGEAAPHLSSLRASSLVSLGSPGPESPAQRSGQPSETRRQAPIRPIHTSSRSKRSSPEVQSRPQRGQSWMQKFQLAKRQHQASHGKDSTYAEKPDSRSGRLGDENEAWMRFVFPKDFGRIQTDFTFGILPSGKENCQATTVSSWDYGTQSLCVSNHNVAEHMSTRAEASAHLSVISAPSAANATIFDPGWGQRIAETGPLARSETDFLSRFSPMEGVLDEGLGDMSVYNNAAASDRSFVSIPQINTGPSTMARWHSRVSAKQMAPTKRDAIYAFDEPSEPTSPNRRQRRKLRATAFNPPLQQGLVQPGALAKSQRTPLQVRGQTVLQAESYGSRSRPTGLSRHRRAVFPMSYSPGSSDKKGTSQQTMVTPPILHLPSTSSPSIANTFDQNLPSLGVGHTLWQVSPSRRGATGSSTTGSQLRGPAPGTPLFGNGGTALEAIQSLYTPRNTQPAISRHF